MSRRYLLEPAKKVLLSTRQAAEKLLFYKAIEVEAVAAQLLDQSQA